jgi:undecaprenyl-diphosphatase
MTADVVLEGSLRVLDGTISDMVPRGETWRDSLVPLTFLGQRGIAVLPLVLVTLLAMVRTRSVRPLVTVVGVLLSTAFVVGAMKLSLGRTAPDTGMDIFGADASSYPSGHAVNTVIIWTLVLRIVFGLYGDKLSAVSTPLRRALLVAMVATGCGISMVGLNYHWLTDVLAGWLLGIALALLAPSPLPRPEPPVPLPAADLVG